MYGTGRPRHRRRGDGSPKPGVLVRVRLRVLPIVVIANRVRQVGSRRVVGRVPKVDAVRLREVRAGWA